MNFKFKVWNESLKQWVDPTVCFFGSDGVFFTFDGGLHKAAPHYKAVFWTGLHDKNGKEIWEGDVVQQPMNQITGYESSDGSPIWGGKTIIKGHVIFKDGRFEVEETIHIWLPLAKVNGVEVLGSIYENPELLKEGK